MRGSVWLILLVVLGCGLAARGGQSTDGPVPDMSIVASPVQNTVKVGQPVALKLTITNTSNHDVVLPYGNSPAWWRWMDVRDSQGNEPLTRRGHIVLKGEPRRAGDPDIVQQFHAQGASIWMLPGHKVQMELDVPRDLYDLSKPGAHTIQIRYDAVNKSNSVSVTITP